MVSTPGHKHVDPTLAGTRRLRFRDITQLPHHQPIRRKSHSPQPSPQVLLLKSLSLKANRELGFPEHELPVLSGPEINHSLF